MIPVKVLKIQLMANLPQRIEYQLQSEAENCGLNVIKSHVGKWTAKDWPAAIRMSFMTRLATA